MHLLFGLGIILIIAIIIPIIEYFISNFAITYKTLSYVMVEVKTIPSTLTVQYPCPSYLTTQVRKFYEVTFLLGDFLFVQNLTFFHKNEQK